MMLHAATTNNSKSQAKRIFVDDMGWEKADDAALRTATFALFLSPLGILDVGHPHIKYPPLSLAPNPR